jgi:hypothetical protein
MTQQRSPQSQTQHAGAVDALDVSTETSSYGTGLALNDDGTKLYACDDDIGEVQSYTLSTAYGLTTASTENRIDISGQDSSPEGIDFGDGGSKLYLAGVSNANVYEYDLSTAYDISTASFNQSLDISGAENYPNGVTVADGGAKLFIYDDYEAYQYDLSTDWDVSTAGAATTRTFGPDYLSPSDASLDFNGDGTRCFWVMHDDAGVVEFELSTAYDMSTRKVKSEHPFNIIPNVNGSLRDAVFVEGEDAFFALMQKYNTMVVWEYPRSV